MSFMSIGELADFIKSSGVGDAALINYKGLTPMWRGAYGPYVVVTGSFRNGGNFEFAIRVPEDAIAVDRKPNNLYIVD